ncbi:hypothetical protein [Pasteurella oralis]|uniref:hypothetical protein n=1 Tax=Pasteurella oralis TaxID=1071947 RepID=UPI000C7CE9AC|nr:hypothetical protein [Pasteurella oralis]
MTKDDFFNKYQLEGSLILLNLDAMDDISKYCYETFMSYRNLPLTEFLQQNDPTENNTYTEEEFISDFIANLDGIILYAKLVKAFIKKRKRSI